MFQRQSIHFGGLGSVPLQGDLDRVLDAEDFFTTVGRPDLARDYVQRRRIGTVVAVAGLAAVAVAGGLAVAEASSSQDCSALFPSDAFSMCVDSNLKRQNSLSTYLPSVLLATGGAVAILVSLAYAVPQIDADEAKNLADAYNQRLRRRLGLPTVTSRPWLRDVRLAPYVARNDGGLVLGARF